MAEIFNLTQKYYFFCLLVFFLVLSFFLGGGARSDIQSLALLRPIAIIFLALGCIGVNLNQFTSYKYLVSFAAGLFALLIFHLVPLPPFALHMLSATEATTQILRQAGVEPSWLPISLAPYRTWNSLLAMIGPLAALVLLIRCRSNLQSTLLLVVIVLSLLSGVIGLVQITKASSSLYFYDITNIGSAVGLMANRNHNALLLATLFPMLAIYASTDIRSSQHRKIKTWFAITAGLLVVPLLLVTGSRGGLLIGLIGLLSGLILYWQHRQPLAQYQKKSERINLRMGFGLIAVAIATLGILFFRSQTISRFFAAEVQGDLRYLTFRPLLQMTQDYFPIGSGIGTFDEIFRLDEPYEQLSPGYFNHAHNDWLELLLTGGVAAGLLMLMAFCSWAWATWIVLRCQTDTIGIAFARLGLVIIFMTGVSSIFDYPLRVPSLALLFVIAAVWTARGITTLELGPSFFTKPK